MKIDEIEKKISEADQESMEAAGHRWKTVAKPLDSLGKLEEAVIRIAGMKKCANFTLDRRGLIIMCGDNGIVQEGVTQTGSEVTAIVANNFTKGTASVCIMGKLAGVDIFPIDIGMNVDVPSLTQKEYKVAYGTRNFLVEPAITREEVERAISVGIEVVRKRKEEGYEILATGEMGIGNTTTSSAIASVLLDEPVERMTGKGAGLDQAGLKRKIEVIEAGIKKHQPKKEDILDVLSKVGGLDVAGLVGVFLGGGVYRIPIIIDGFISSVAALCALQLVPRCRDYMVPSHVSKEPGGQHLLDALGFSPLLTCDMSLGEGSGAVGVIPLLDMGLQVYRKMSTFEEINVNRYEELK
ncbi:nicotinate-nucleotide--dimethylbenzimidazole phosphoribosyltransferase [Aequitasia blattaphilus]|uniref:Nicotinate-nucleotide--dimethylbenzimidazole phosphoribosyltransferase n=1 Tax=Aequitasia blattaphilus TaxID=2949332 RepID=A0ABT1E8L4_9FIRM|nr:nicotinate-nucleotide--dimethylbenzimidazole phosphoribosyltransferase [Aequitasia blattaphilus]MCP1102169.1 nicotinate-nucleotide--dimethylbenzimidazole phosphoribosyltransferase [Aequitasia blattaphilus]MCR8614809.1 nicotinate-nucleotide--dimethylbenzimidazole phosphoribosyltransferase [Aequitasia blattaphilus]